MREVIVVGAGPAGAYLAYLLAREGIDVLLLEKERLPRYKPCGGGVTPKAQRLLDFDLTPVIEDTIHTVVLTCRLARPVTVTRDRPTVYMVTRERFDAFLVDKAKEAGAQVLDGVRVNRVKVSDNEVSVQAGGMELRGRLLAGADGTHSIVARTLGLAPGKRIAVTLESEIAVPGERLGRTRGTIKADYGLVPGGYAWVFPKAERFSVGVGSVSPRFKGLRSRLRDVLRAEGLADLSPPPQTRGWTIPVNPRPEKLHAGRALVVGDAAGLADPFTGEGIYAALFSARLAAETISGQIKRPRSNLEQYTAMVQEKMGPEMARAYRIARWFHPFPGLFHSLLRHEPKLLTDFTRLLAGEIDYAGFTQSCRRLLPAALLRALLLPHHGLP